MLPGQFVRETILKPKGISVTQAAKLVGVGRPAMSNFLNGKAALSADMATRIEKAFGVPAQELLDRQAAHDAAAAKSKGSPAETKAYVPPFLAIKSNEIEHWAASNISARTRLSVFLRTLVNSTGIGLTKVDYPGNDDAERPGWDGFVAAAEGTPWIPTGNSGWEFGCNAEPKEKADSDYANRTKAVADKAVRADTTFVFVTPRTWKGKTKWESDRRAEGQWKDVRAFDASDLEQWLEQSIAAQAWFAGETKLDSGGARSLDRCWADWADVSKPSLAAALFTTAVRTGSSLIGSLLSKPPEAPIIIAADSSGEAFAFLAQLFSGMEGGLASYRDRVLVFDKPGVLPRLAEGRSNFIAITANREVERELAPFSHQIPSIVIYPRNAANAEPHISLEPLNYEALRTALETMGFNRDDIDRLARESGRSLTVLQRRLSTVPAIKTPAWASDSATARRLVPFLFAGAWNSSTESDKIILQFLADGTEYKALEKELQALASVNDAPVWSVGSYRGVISKIDLLFAISSSITSSDLKTFFDVARLVLAEDDPSVDLPEEDQWKAGIFGKTREISAVLRKGISETLVLLAVHGNSLFQARLGTNTEASAARLIEDLLSPLTTRTLEVHERDLPTYAETAPDTFLSLLENDLRNDQPATIGLMRPASTGVFGRCIRSGLLWALEGLAWSPGTLSRVVLVLARLAGVTIDDNWSNKPIESLKAIFRSWMPQTAANLDERLRAMGLLSERFPQVGWTVCLDQFGEYHRVGHYSHKPQWRNDGHGFGDVVTPGEVASFERSMVDMALNWRAYDRPMLEDLIQRLHALHSTHQARVWELVQTWARDHASDNDKARLLDKIRVAVTVSQRRAARRGEAQPPSELVEAAKRARKALEPTDLLNRHEWLFRQNWVDESADELEATDFQKRDAKIARLRTEALQEIVDQRGIQGVLEFAEMGKAANIIGALVVSIIPANQIADFLLATMPPKTESWARKNLVFGALHAIANDDERAAILRQVRQQLATEDLVKILVFAPFRQSTWSFIDGLETTAREQYWANVAPDWPPDTNEDLNTAAERLLDAKRPRAAFHCVHFKLNKVRPGLLFRMMKEIATGKDEAPGRYQLDSYYISQAFNLLDTSGEFSVEQLAGLEFPYIDALSRDYGGQQARGIPNLELYLEDHPELYVEVVAWLYKRNDGGEDPAGLKLDDAELVADRAERGFRLLESLERIPGRDKFGAISEDQLIGWLSTVRRGCTELGRQQVGDISLGKLLSSAPVGSDGVWPCEPVRQALEKLQSEDISKGIVNGLYNARGVHLRSEGGDQERDLAAKYRRWTMALEFSHPFLASTILKRMALTYEEEGKYHDTEARVRRRL